MGKDVLRRFRRNIGSLLRDLGGGCTGDSLLLILAAQSLNIPLHGPLYVEAWEGEEKRRKTKKKQKWIHRFRFFFVVSLFSFAPPPPPPPKVCTYSGPCEEPCSRSEWPAATKGTPYQKPQNWPQTENSKTGACSATCSVTIVVEFESLSSNPV